MAFENLEFSTGLIDNLLSVDHWPELKSKRKARYIWGLTTRSNLTNEQVTPYLALAQRMTVAVDKTGQGVTVTTDDKLETKTFEGR